MKVDWERAGDAIDLMWTALGVVMLVVGAVAIAVLLLSCVVFIFGALPVLGGFVVLGIIFCVFYWWVG